MSDYSVFAQTNPGTDYPVKDANLRAQLTLDSDKIDYAATGYAFGYKRNATSGLNAGYYGGVISSGGSLTTIADGTIALTASQTNYVERTQAGVISKNTSGFTAGKIPMFAAVTNGTDVTGVTDKRQRNVFGDLYAVGALGVTGNATVGSTAANYLQFEGAANGVTPALSAKGGSDSNVTLAISSKGTGDIKLYSANFGTLLATFNGAGSVALPAALGVTGRATIGGVNLSTSGTAYSSSVATGSVVDSAVATVAIPTGASVHLMLVRETTVTGAWALFGFSADLAAMVKISSGGAGITWSTTYNQAASVNVYQGATGGGVGDAKIQNKTGSTLSFITSLFGANNT